MRIEITSRALELTDTMRDHIEKRLMKFKRYFDGVSECHVIAKTERFVNRFEITLHGKGFDLFSEASGPDPYGAFDSAAERMERQITKLKGKIKDRRSRKGGLAPVGEVVEAEEIAEENEGD